MGCFLFSSFNALSQKYLGLSANFGNQFNFNPTSEGLKRPISASGNLFFLSQERIKNNWVVQSSARLGVLGYQLKILPYDTLNNHNDPFSFFTYLTFYGGIEVLLGKEIPINNKTLTISGGAGGTYYYCPFPRESLGVSKRLNDGSSADIFDAIIESNSKSLIGFTKLSALFELNSSLVIGLGYSYHFSPIMTGKYQFYHTKTPSSGDIRLNQNELSAVIMYKFSKENFKHKQVLTPIENQGNFYLGFETALTNDLYKIEDDGDNLVPAKLYSGTWGFNLRKDLNAPIFLEAGFIYKYYWHGLDFKNIPPLGSGGGDNSWLIPLRLGVYTNVYKKKIYFVPLIGYTFGINPPFGFGRTSGNYMDSNTIIEYQYFENPNVSRFFSLLQTGIGFEALFYNKLLCSLSANYYSGFNTTSQLDITYTINNATPVEATAISKGQFWNVNFGLKYAL